MRTAANTPRYTQGITTHGFPALAAAAALSAFPWRKLGHKGKLCKKDDSMPETSGETEGFTPTAIREFGVGQRRNGEPDVLWDTGRALEGLQGCGGWGGGLEFPFWRSRAGLGHHCQGRRPDSSEGGIVHPLLRALQSCDFIV